MIGLKTYLPKLSELLGVSPEMLYERQRALVRYGYGLLPAEPGRGPGSGVRADAHSLSVFFMSLLAHDELTLVGVTMACCALRSIQRQCPLTRHKLFHQALTEILSRQDLAERVAAVTVNRNSQIGVIEYSKKGRTPSKRLLRSEFLIRGSPRIRGIETIKSLDHNIVVQVAKDIAAFSEVAK
jgi:hypothetical protein